MKDVYSNGEFDSSDPLKPSQNKSILDSYRYINGRRYHNLSNATYFFPNDEKEAARLNLQHNIFKFVWQNNFSSPVHELLRSGKAKVLDIGCGTGQWILDMAKEYPKATFMGVDMSPMFPDAKNTPPNVFFLQLNLNDGLPFPTETFDFVNQRNLCSCVALEQWKFYVKEMIRVTKSGGWLEFFEYDFDYQKATPYFIKVADSMFSEFLAKGINPKPETCVPQFLKNCQELSKIHFKEVHMPTGKWPDQFGAMVATYVTMNADAIKLLVSSGWGVNDETYNHVINNTKHEFDDKIYHRLFRWYTKKI